MKRIFSERGWCGAGNLGKSKNKKLVEGRAKGGIRLVLVFWQREEKACWNCELNPVDCVEYKSRSGWVDRWMDPFQKKILRETRERRRREAWLMVCVSQTRLEVFVWFVVESSSQLQSSAQAAEIKGGGFSSLLLVVLWVYGDWCGMDEAEYSQISHVW